MSLWAKSNVKDHEMDKEVCFSADPLNVLLRLEDRAIARLHPRDLADERAERKLNKREQTYVHSFINRNVK